MFILNFIVWEISYILILPRFPQSISISAESAEISRQFPPLEVYSTKKKVLCIIDIFGFPLFEFLSAFCCTFSLGIGWGEHGDFRANIDV